MAEVYLAECSDCGWRGRVWPLTRLGALLAGHELEDHERAEHVIEANTRAAEAES